MLRFHNSSRFSAVLWAVLTFFDLAFVKYCPET
jgi:hypothetical protein